MGEKKNKALGVLFLPTKIVSMIVICMCSSFLFKGPEYYFPSFFAFWEAIPTLCGVFFVLMIHIFFFSSSYSFSKRYPSLPPLPLRSPPLYSYELQAPSFPSLLPRWTLFQSQYAAKPRGGLCSWLRTLPTTAFPASRLTPVLPAGSSGPHLPCSHLGASSVGLVLAIISSVEPPDVSPAVCSPLSPGPRERQDTLILPKQQPVLFSLTPITFCMSSVNSRNCSHLLLCAFPLSLTLQAPLFPPPLLQ